MAYIALHRNCIAFLIAALATGGCGGRIAQPSQDAGADANEYEELLAMRVLDYSAALKAAALRLTGDLPTLDEIRKVADGTDDAARHAAYQSLLRDYLARPAFARQMLYFWRDAFRIGGTPELDTAPALAAKLSVENGSYLELFTRAAANCPAFDEATATFRDAECSNGGPRAGVLTDPAVMATFVSSLGFRRVRWVQETFACTRFPVEISGPPRDVGGLLPYLGVWPFGSGASPNTGGRINFQDVESTVCMNCHQTINHIAPLFAYYDETGAYRNTIAVRTPFDGPIATLADYLPATETTAWRYGVEAPDLPALGAAMAADDDVIACAVARIWNWALGKTDIVDSLQEVPRETIGAQVAAFKDGGHRIKDLVFAVFDSEDFTRY
jgi:hypothetical protein